MNFAPHPAWRFDRFVFDPSNGGLFRLSDAGAREPIMIGGRALDVLATLVAHSGELVVKQAIMQAVWPDVSVEEKNLTVQISTLRRVLDQGRADSCIQTVPGHGYRLVVPAERLLLSESLNHSPPAAPPPAVQVVRLSEHPAIKSALARMLPRLPAALAALLLAVTTAGWFSQHPALPDAYSPQDRRQSLIVLPFENSSGDPAQDSLAANITSDLTELAAQDQTEPTVPVATAAAYRGKALNLRVIGREHDVHFALMGSARRQDGRLIVSAILYETIHARQLWSQRFEQLDTPEVWARVANAIHASVDQATMDEEVARAMRDHPNSLDKRDLMFASKASSLSQSSAANIRTRIALIDRALSLDPNYIWALRDKARRSANLVTGGFSTDPEHDLQVAVSMVDHALMLAPDDYWVLREKAVVLRAQANWKEAAALNQRLIERQPLSAFRHHELGADLMSLGLHQQALEQYRLARLVAVSSDSVNDIDSGLAMALVAKGEFSEAIEQARFAIQEFTPENGRAGEAPWLALIAAESANGQEAEARADLAKFLARTRSWQTVRLVQQMSSFAANPNLIKWLRHAGMPEE